MTVGDLIELLRNIGDGNIPVAILSEDGDEYDIRAISMDALTDGSPFVWIECIVDEGDDTE